MLLTDADKSLDNPFNQDIMPYMEWGSEFWMSLFDQLDTPILIYKPCGRLVYSNSEASRILGLSGKEGDIIPDYLYPLIKGATRLEIYDHGREVCLTGSDGNCDHPFILKNLSAGSYGSLILATGLVKDRLNGSSSETRYRFCENESMEMANEVSQKVKGPLAGIELYASILGEELDERADSSLTAIIDEIRYSVREVNEYLTSFESMTKPLSLSLKPWNLAEVVDDALVSLNSLFKSKGIGVLVEQKDIVVEVDKTLMVQTFLNILLNAAEAMPNGGRLIVRQEINRRGEAEVIFTDSGPGVPLMDTKKIFNPFFTTKKQPLGLGLPVSQRIVDAHQGQIVFGLDEIMGARVKVVLPYIPGDSGATGVLN
jgi:nitrogen-specific signal transduction histidine kinase